MTKDPEITVPAWDIAFKEIGKRLEEGKSVAFITEGDPLFFSTYIYLHKVAPKRWPGVQTEIVPAVSSFTAVPSVIQAPIADGQERVAVVPASYGLDTLPQILDLFDTVLLMKVSSIMPQLVDILKEKIYLITQPTSARQQWTSRVSSPILSPLKMISVITSVWS